MPDLQRYLCKLNQINNISSFFYLEKSLIFTISSLVYNAQMRKSFYIEIPMKNQNFKDKMMDI